MLQFLEFKSLGPKQQSSLFFVLALFLSVHSASVSIFMKKNCVLYWIGLLDLNLVKVSYFQKSV